MLSYNFNQLNDYNDLHFKLKKTKEQELFISHTILKYLNSSKKKIDEYPEKWANIKKYTNEYEYIHTPISINKSSISKINPLSRAFFKLIEILNYIKYENINNIKTFHLAEGPGGFIEATKYYRNNKNDTYYGMSLINTEDKNVPGWDKAQIFLNSNKNINIITGNDNTGDLYTPENYIFCVENFKNSMEIITADGGFDFSIDFNKQESMASRLILTEVFYAITMQKYNGTFILKMFDTFLQISTEILYILSCFYKNVEICKPKTSRMANSEKYIICQGFKLYDSELFINIFKDIIIKLKTQEKDNSFIHSILSNDVGSYFKNKVEEINAIFGFKQVNNILTTIRFIENNEKKTQKMQTIKVNNIKNCVDWCKKHNIPHYAYNASTSNDNNNIFISKS